MNSTQTTYRVEFQGWKQNGKPVGHQEGIYVADFYPHFERDAEYATVELARAAMFDFRGPDVDGVEPFLVVVAA